MLTERTNITKRCIFRKDNFKKTQKQYSLTVLELFAGGGGMALGFEQAGFKHVLLNEINKRCCSTLHFNRPDWSILKADISTVNFNPYYDKVDVVSGGFPCQAFSIAGKREGFNDCRGALFFEFLRVVKEVRPKVFVIENVKGLISHDQGKTLKVILEALNKEKYKVKVELLKAIHYRVPQKRERLFIIGVRNDISFDFQFPKPNKKTYTLHDALKAGELFTNDVPSSPGFNYLHPQYEALNHVFPGGNWRDLPLDLQKNFLGKWYGQGSNSHVARRLAWNEPCLTLLVSPVDKRSCRCHPDETRPFTTREYARIQTFPDDWVFTGSISAQYRQIGNAVPVNLAYSIACSIAAFLNRLTIQN